MKKILQKNTDKVLHQTHASTLRRASLVNIDLTGADLAGEDLSAALLDGATLDRANLSGANLTGAQLNGTVLREADLSGANLSRADLYGASLRGARLSGADLSDARLDGADLRGAHLENASMKGATYGNRIPGRSDLMLAWYHIQRILVATPGFLLRRLLPVTLPLVGIMVVFFMLRIAVLDFEYDRTRIPASWPDYLPALIGDGVVVVWIVALVLFLRRLLARLGTRSATEGYLGLLFFIVAGVYMAIALSGFMNDVAREALENTLFRVSKILGFALLVSIALAILGVPTRLRRYVETRVDATALWTAIGILVGLSCLGFVLLDARLMLAPFRGEFPIPEDVAAFWRHVELYVAFILALLVVWGLIPRLPMPATLGRADLKGVDLGGANLRGINLRAADLSGAALTGADLRHSDLREARLDGAGLREAVYDANTRWPDGFDPAAHGARPVATPFWNVPITSLLLRRK